MTKQNPDNVPTGNVGNLTWSSHIEVNSLTDDKVDQSSRAGEEARRPKTSRIEREILWAVVVLYLAIIACFAGLHLIGLAQAR